MNTKIWLTGVVVVASVAACASSAGEHQETGGSGGGQGTTTSGGVGGQAASSSSTSASSTSSSGAPPCNPGGACGSAAACSGSTFIGAGLCDSSHTCGPGTTTDCGATGKVCDPESGCVACNVDIDCPAGNNPCAVVNCVAHACVTTDLGPSHALPTGQTPGNCQQLVCDGKGGTTSLGDPGNAPISTTVCQTHPTCSGTPLTPTFTPAPAGTSCVADGKFPNKVCDAAGTCVECNVAADCPPTADECVVRTCTAGVCGTMNLGPTHVLTTGQTPGDCQTVVCDGFGGKMSVDDPSDLPTSAGLPQCNLPACVGSPSRPGAQPAPTGTHCHVALPNFYGVCEPVGTPTVGQCVACLSNVDCLQYGGMPALVCINHTCV